MGRKRRGDSEEEEEGSEDEVVGRKRNGRSVYAEEESEEDEVSDRKRKSKKRRKDKEDRPRRSRGGQKANYTEDDEDEDEESVHTRRESKNGKYKEVASDEEEEDLEEEATPKRVKPARSSKKKPTVIDSEEDNGQNGHADTNENGVEEIDDSDEDIPLGKRNKKKKSIKVSSDEDEKPLGQRRKNSTEEEKNEGAAGSSDEDDKPLGQRRKNSTDEEKKKKDSDSEEKAPEGDTKKKRERKGRCQTCSGCKRDDCGKCTNCKDKAKFGGRNVLKQACELRVCLEMSVREKRSRPKKGPRRAEDNDDDEDVDGDDEDIDESTVQRQQLNQDKNLRGSSRKSIKQNKNKNVEEVVLESEDDEESSEDEQYVVEKILEKRTDSELGFTLYKVKWRGFSYEECTWEPIENLTDETGTCVHLERFEEKLKLKEMIGDEEEEDEEEGKKKRKRKGSDEDDFDGDEAAEEEDPDEMDVDDEDDVETEDSSQTQKRSTRDRKQTKAFEAESSARSSRKSSRRPSLEEDEGSELEEKERKKKKKEKKRDKVKTKKKKKVIAESGSDEEFSFGGAVPSKKKKIKKVHKGATTGRERKGVSYVHSDSHSHESDRYSGYETPEEVEKVDVETIDFVMDHREGKVGATGESTKYHTVLEKGDPNELLETKVMEKQFLIKWKGKAHLDNTWETEETINAMKKGTHEVKGQRKMVNYELKLSDYLRWKKKADKEEIEYQEVEIEQGRLLLKTYLECERIFSRRKTEDDTYEYYMKWRNLPYVEATWEPEERVKAHYAEELKFFKDRKRAGNDPADYKQAMKVVKRKFVLLKEQPEFIGSESLRMRDYQLDGINFLLRAWHKKHSLILADEMGLGKTIQSITFLHYLFHNYSFKGPMLVVVPLSTMAAWQSEFARWASDMNTITYVGDAKSREIIREYECENENGELSFNAILTSYEMVSRDREFFADIIWSNIVVDEAHRLKSDNSLLYKVLVEMESHHRLLLTGTPLQNNLRELWCLLNYLKIEEVSSWEIFESEYGTEEERSKGYLKLHTLLKPYIIRRMKKDVEKSMPPKVEQILRVDMTIKQKKLYKLVLTKNYSELQKGKKKTSLLNILMQLRKTCNHAELIQEIDSTVQQTTEQRLQQLIYGSGKLVLLDKLLTRFKTAGDRVLIFSQMVIMLDVIQEYCELKRHRFQRLDGGVSAEARRQSIAQFNDKESADFCFLLSTKAGGLGINLQTANRVIIYDSDFNPQNDLQAIARAHRIGQKQEVKIFRLVASCSVDEDIIQRAKNKMVLDHLVIQNMDTTGKTVISGAKGKKAEDSLDKDDLQTIIKFGAADLFKGDGDAEEETEKEVDLDAILEKAETKEEEEAPQSEANKELLGAFKCTNIALEEEDDEEEEKEREKERLKELKRKAKREEMSWDAIIPENQREKERQFRTVEGLEIFSDQDENYHEPIAARKRRRTVKKKDKENGDAGSDSDGGGRRRYKDEDDDFEAESDSEASDAGSDGAPAPTKFMHSLQCLKCNEGFALVFGLVAHMKEKHNEPEFNPEPENYINMPDVKTKKNYCFVCRTPGPSRRGYQVHVNSRHGGVEPVQNYNMDKLKVYMAKRLGVPLPGTLPGKMRLTCLDCAKVFTNMPGLKRHMLTAHGNEAFVADEEHFLDLPICQSTMYRCFPCNRSLTALNYRLHLHGKHMGPKGVNEPPINFDPVRMAFHEELTKPMICTICKVRLTDPHTLRRHMSEAHSMNDFQIQDSNYYNLPEVKSVMNRCLPCGRQFAQAVLYRLHVKNKHGSKEPPQNITDAPKLAAMFQQAPNRVPLVPTPGVVLPSGITVTPVAAGSHTQKKCMICQRAFMTQSALNSHMLMHQGGMGAVPGGMQMSQQAYMALPMVESVMNRCLPCLKSFPSGLRYKIHIKDEHGGKEPIENYDPEKCVQPDDFICLICIKKFKNRNGLKTHIQNHHLGGVSLDASEPEKKEEKPENLEGKESTKEEDKGDKVEGQELSKEESAEKKESEKEDEKGKETNDTDGGRENTDPNADPLDTNSTADKDESTGNKAEEENKADTNQEEKVNEKDISNGHGEDKNAPGAEEKKKEKADDDDDIMIISEQTTAKVTKPAPSAVKPPSSREEMLIKKMLELLKKYGCEFCSQRFDTKFALSHHERSHLTEHQRKVEQDPDFIRKKLKLNPDGTPREKEHKDTKMGSVQKHDNENGPQCFKCGQICKDNSNLRNHILSHYYRIFDPLLPKTKPFPCPVCEKPSRDKITMIRHFAFTHQKLFELTDVTPADLLTSGTPRKKNTLSPEGTPTGRKSHDEESTEPKEEKQETEEQAAEDKPTNGNHGPEDKVKEAQVDDCKAPIIDDSSEDSGEEEGAGGMVKVRLDKDSTRFLYAWINSRLENPFPTAEQRDSLAAESGLTVKQVDNWFRKKRKAMGVPEIETEVPKKKVTPKKKGKKKGKKKASSSEDEEEDEEEDEAVDYVVETILDTKVEKGKGNKPDKTLYLVKWLGWDREEDLTWEPLEHLQDPDGTCQALADFEKNQKAKAEVLSLSEDESESKSGHEGDDAADPITLSSSPIQKSPKVAQQKICSVETIESSDDESPPPTTRSPTPQPTVKESKICSAETVATSSSEEEEKKESEEVAEVEEVEAMEC